MLVLLAKKKKEHEHTIRAVDMVRWIFMDGCENEKKKRMIVIAAPIHQAFEDNFHDVCFFMCLYVYANKWCTQGVRMWA